MFPTQDLPYNRLSRELGQLAGPKFDSRVIDLLTMHHKPFKSDYKSFFATHFFQNYEIRYKQKIIEFRQSGRDSVSLKKIKSIETKI